ncbi:MAG: class I SAM-dependent methyltransferase [Leptospira sp.]|nr:class I SAM-dependent methyltransferase [Leptospira sp.]
METESEPTSRKSHWENVYNSKKLEEVSWFQPKPETTLSFLSTYKVPLSARIIDIGGGDSYLVDHLLDLGYTNVSVLDISEKALERVKARLAERAKLVQWIVSDAAKFVPDVEYDFWHDRAAFHFLTDPSDIAHYVESAKKGIRKGGNLVVGTFSDKGPLKCSGLEIRQYTKDSMVATFGEDFNLLDSNVLDHKTPGGNVQNFIFCGFERV